MLSIESTFQRIRKVVGFPSFHSRRKWRHLIIVELKIFVLFYASHIFINTYETYQVCSLVELWHACIIYVVKTCFNFPLSYPGKMFFVSWNMYVWANICFAQNFYFILIFQNVCEPSLLKKIRINFDKILKSGKIPLEFYCCFFKECAKRLKISIFLMKFFGSFYDCLSTGFAMNIFGDRFRV